MVSHKVVLSRKVVLSCQALCRSAQVVSLRTSWVAATRRNLGTSIGISGFPGTLAFVTRLQAQ